MGQGTVALRGTPREFIRNAFQDLNQHCALLVSDGREGYLEVGIIRWKRRMVVSSCYEN